jgi:hypothetical protein
VSGGIALEKTMERFAYIGFILAVSLLVGTTCPAFADDREGKEHKEQRGDF